MKKATKVSEQKKLTVLSLKTLKDSQLNQIIGGKNIVGIEDIINN